MPLWRAAPYLDTVTIDDGLLLGSSYQLWVAVAGQIYLTGPEQPGLGGLGRFDRVTGLAITGKAEARAWQHSRQ